MLNFSRQHHSRQHLSRKRTSILCALFLPTLLSGCFLFGSKGEEDKKTKVKDLVKAPSKSELELLESAQASYDRGLFKLSSDSWSELRDGYPSSYYSVVAELKLADAHFFAREFPEALVVYEEFSRTHPGHEAMAYVRFQIADCNFQQYQGVGTDHSVLSASIEKFEKVITDFRSSEWAARARGRITEASEALAENELSIARFYLQQEKWGSALNRYLTLRDSFSETEIVKNQLSVLAEELRASGKISENELGTTGSRSPTQPKNLTVASLAADSIADSGAAGNTSERIVSPLECELQLDGAAIYTAHLKLPARIATQEAKNAAAVSATIALIGSEGLVRVEDQTLENSCETANGNVAVVFDEQLKPESFTLEISKADRILKHSISLLENPDRIIVVLSR